MFYPSSLSEGGIFVEDGNPNNEDDAPLIHFDNVEVFLDFLRQCRDHNFETITEWFAWQQGLPEDSADHFDHCFYEVFHTAQKM